MDGSDVRQGAALYERILGDVRARIISGEWPPGHRVPSEHEFTIAYDCSRMTVNKALTRLAEAGLIERRRRAGSFVARPHSQSAVLKISDVGAEVAELGLRYHHEVLHQAIRRATRLDRDLLGVAAGTGLLEISCRHFAGDTPFCLERRVISLTAVPEAARQDFRDLGPGAWLVAHVPWTRAEHRIRATSASREVARAMSVPAGAACLVVVRRTWRDAVPVTRVELTYDSSHVIVARFTPAGTI
ncbi:MAG: histidine utilization repressor [Rhodospirillales bacterium]|nr:histidine utilization repressor [Rhodospirillales bacterium]